MSVNGRLLVNADDFGLHTDIDRGILECIECGRVQSVSFAATGRTVDWNKLRELIRHGVRVGLHVVLVGEPWASGGRLLRGWKDLVKQLLLPGRTMKDAIDGEVRRQFQLCSDNGLDPRSLSHVDSHQHVHALKGVWQPCLRLAHEHGIPRIRVPWCPSPQLIKKNVAGFALQVIAHRRAAEVCGFLPCLGLAQAGRNTAAIFSNELEHAVHAGRPDIELVVHPGVNTPDLESRYADWHFDWNRERDALLSTQFAEAVNASGYKFLASPPLEASPEGAGLDRGGHSDAKFLAIERQNL
jgi:chitin disaccharide deacetylase